MLTRFCNYVSDAAAFMMTN